MTSGTFANKLKYEFVSKGNDVITFGDYGDKFYITLYGNVGVLIPLPKPKVEQKETKPPLVKQKTLIRRKTIVKKDDIISLPKPPQPQVEEKQEVKEEDKESEKSEDTDKTQKEDSQKEVIIEEVYEEEEKEEENYKEVAILPAGTSFGELALISHKPRAATIRAKEDWHFAVLEKKQIIKKYMALYRRKY